MKNWKNSYSILVVIFLAVMLIAAKAKYHQKNIFAYDNFGYYLYLPAQFIFHDAGFENFKIIEDINAKYNCTPNYYQIMQSPKGKLIIRMYAGTAILLTPAFFTGHLIALNSNYPQDGFSIPYQMSVMVFGILLTLLGIIYARKILLKFFPDKLVALTLLILYLGTNLLFFITLGNPMPHAYLFNLYVFLIWSTLKWHENPSWLYSVSLGTFLGLIIAIRPSDIIVVLIPILWGIYSKESMLAKFKLILLHWKQFLLIGFILALFALPQALYWRFQAGEYFLSVYTDPGSQMQWSEPNILNTLFSFRKGWFVYSPLIILAVAGIFISLWRNRSFFLFTFLFVALNIYMISCFTSLISYGWRAFIQSYAVLLLPLGVAVEFILMRPKWVSWLLFIVIAAFTYLNLVQTYQTGLGVIDSSRMTKEAYFKILGKWNAKAPEEFYLIKRSAAFVDTLEDAHNYSIRKIIDRSYEIDEDLEISGTDSAYSYVGKRSFCMQDTLMYLPILNVPVSEILGKNDHFWVRTNVEILSYDTLVASEGILVVTIESNKKEMKYRGMSIDKLSGKFELGRWNNLRFDYLSPEFMPDDAILKIYFWNKGRNKIWIDDLKVYLYTPEIK